MKIEAKNIIARRSALFGACALLFAQLQGCAIHEIYKDQAAVGASANAAVDGPQASQPVVQVHDGAWLLGEKIRASKPQPQLYDKQVAFTPVNGSTATLGEIADYIQTFTHVPVLVDASVSHPSAATGVVVTRALPLPAGGPLPPGGIQGSALGGVAGPSDGVPFSTYRGDFRGFLDTVDERFGVWSQYRDGTVTFLRTETRTFMLPTIADQAAMSGSISTGDSGGSSGGSSGSVGSNSSSGSSNPSTVGSATGAGGQNISLNVSATPWLTLQSTAQAIAGDGAKVVADKDLQILSVTGTPPQCDRVDEFVKNLNAMYGKQVAIDVQVYEVQLNEEHNYGLNLTLAYKNSTGHTGLQMASASTPTITSTSTPMTFGATILSGPLAGSSAAVQALSTLGNVSQLISRAGITQNGKVLALQSAKQQGYVQSTQSTLAASVGTSTTLQTGTLVPGFTSSFLPKVVNGRILIDFDMTLSDLLSLQTFTSGSGSSESSVQLPNMQITRFEQSVSLNPGEALVLTGMRQRQTSTTNNGVGSAYNPLAGGGLDAQRNDTVIAVVISARLM